MPNDTRAVLGQNAEKCDSRSLLFDRFAEPEVDGDHRRIWFRRVIDKPAITLKSASWLPVARSVAPIPGSVLHAQLQSRLMINMAGGVMENAGLCLDRFGVPYIPGSAVKGCARRAATQALVDEASRSRKAALLSDIALVFGWGDTDWKSGRKRRRQGDRGIETEPCSDFWWAMALDTGDGVGDDMRRQEIWQEVARTAARSLLDHLRFAKREHLEEPWRDLPNFAGSIAFLPAYPADIGRIGQVVEDLPLEVPALGKLELDVVTCHHHDYYEERLEIATDTEEPNPVVFPAVAPGHVFTFAVAPLRAANADLGWQARSWLQTGLETFGLGAKTNAGYGWFKDVSEDLERARTAEIRRQVEEAMLRREAEARAVALAALQPDPSYLCYLRSLKEADLRGQINAYAPDDRFWTEKDERKQLAVLHFLIEDAPSLFSTDRANAKSKIAKAIKQLQLKFPGLGPNVP